jgi:hypothetical protein
VKQNALLDHAFQINANCKYSVFNPFAGNKLVIMENERGAKIKSLDVNKHLFVCMCEKNNRTAVEIDFVTLPFPMRCCRLMNVFMAEKVMINKHITHRNVFNCQHFQFDVGEKKGSEHECRLFIYYI